MNHKNLVLAALLAVTTSAFAESMPERPDGPEGKKDVTRAEFLERAGEHFQKADSNGDGVLSVAERKAAREARREKREARREKREAR